MGDRELAAWRERTHEVIFESDTPAGKRFDVVLLIVIVVSVVAVMLESVRDIQREYGAELRTLDWVITGLFSVEYAVRLLCVRRPVRYAVSFFGLVDLMAILPTYLSLFLPGAQALSVVRTLRLLRVFRVLKLVHFLSEVDVLRRALAASRRKIMVFVSAVVTAVVVLGSLMYMIEGAEHGFTSIPISVYWAVVTLTTVGYGDISPETPLGQAVAALIMILGYGMIAVPTGVVTMEIANASRPPPEHPGRVCPSCTAEGHLRSAAFCHSCGAPLA